MQNYLEDGQILKSIAEGDSEISILGDIQGLPGEILTGF